MHLLHLCTKPLTYFHFSTYTIPLTSYLRTPLLPSLQLHSPHRPPAMFDRLKDKLRAMHDMHDHHTSTDRPPAPVPAPLSPPPPGEMPEAAAMTTDVQDVVDATAVVPVSTVVVANTSVRPEIQIPADAKLQLAMVVGALGGIARQMIHIANEWEAEVYALRYEYDVYRGGETRVALPLPKHVRSLPKAEAFSSCKIGRITERAHQFIRAQMPLLARLDKDPQVMFQDLGFDPFRAFFGAPELFPEPKSISDGKTHPWRSDVCFARQFLTGCNPTVIERPDKARVDAALPEEFRAVKAPDGRGIQQLLSDNALFWADYAVLTAPGIGELDPEQGYYTNKVNFLDPKLKPLVKIFYAPFVVFYKDAVSGELGVLGIMLTRNQSPNFIYRQETCQGKEMTYLLAKMHVSSADNQTHQFYYHLGRCHIVFEPFGVAAKNVFQFGDDVARDHVVGRLLMPHFLDTIAINWLARNTLVASDSDVQPFTDAAFAAGAEGGIRLMIAKYSTWNFSDQAFPQSLKNRGFDPRGATDGLRDYYYRDDGMLIWNALERYVQQCLDQFYDKSDEKVATDGLLKEWCAEMRSDDRANVKSFPSHFTTRADLCIAITTIIYNVSAEHAAVNASQERYLAYVPNRPNALYKGMPQVDADGDLDITRDILMTYGATEEDRGASMPLSFAMFQVQFCQLLTVAPTKTLMDLDAMKDYCPAAYDGLMGDLERAHYRIKARNLDIVEKDPQLPPYEFLDPKQVAQSIEI